ncbi:expressed unknown protein [Seminavis robusta]|uniref:Ubiquitin-like domain-containing protein n=1 Tax=Seminavis robusta TaxID=568900 RepID=A0A9N8DTF9_9STRA|nr:expressed unknown protein [Seminavis robusta]|eukprot:Sro265_g102840.1 n/a (568) ;mRNA; f:51538-53241
MESRDLRESSSTCTSRVSDPPETLAIYYNFKKNAGIRMYDWKKEDHCLEVPFTNSTLTIGDLRGKLFDRFIGHEEFRLPPCTVAVPIKLFPVLIPSKKLSQDIDESNDDKLFIETLLETVPSVLDCEHPLILLNPVFDYKIQVDVIENPVYDREDVYDTNLDESVAKPGTIVQVCILQSECTSDAWLQKIYRAVGMSELDRAHVLWKGDEIVSVPFVREWSESRLQIWINQWRLCVRTLGGETIRVSVNPLDTPKALVDVIKDQSWRLRGLPWGASFGLVNSNNGTILSDDAEGTLQSLGVNKDSILYIILSTKAPTRHNGCTIPKAEHRGMTIDQLQEIARIVLTRCVPEKWTSTNPDHDDKLLRPEDVTLYDLMHHYIKPETLARNYSYVEPVSESEETIRGSKCYFTSHWWGGPVLDYFVACLSEHATHCSKRHAQNDSQGPPITYWICDYAIRQHDVKAELHVDPTNNEEHVPPPTVLDTRFFRAMEWSKGTVPVLDAEATTYKRIWCVFELFVTLDVRKAASGAYAYDICAMDKGDTGPAVLLDPTDKHSDAYTVYLCKFPL